MRPRPARLRLGELLAGAAAVALLVLLLAVHWYGARTGWQVLTSARWAVLVTVAAALVLVFAQATRPAPALPATMSLIVTVFGLVTVLWLIYRVAISPAAHERVGAWLGLLSACLMTASAFWSLRQEGISPEDEPHEVPVVPLSAAQGSAGAPD
jgi:hypothetical protein